MIDRDFVTSGHAFINVYPSPAFIAARAQLGDEYHDEYGYLVERVHLNGPHWPPQYFIKSKVARKRGVEYVYLGELDAKTGSVKLTKRSAFPETATRVTVIRRILARIWEGKGELVERAGWRVVNADDACVAVA